MKVLLTVSAAIACLLVSIPSAAARDFPPPTPFRTIALSQLGYGDTTLTGLLVSADYFLPGPADFVPDGVSSIDLQIVPSQLLARDSSLVVLWNGIAVHNGLIGGASGQPQRLSLPIASDRIAPELNRLQIQAQLRLTTDTCDLLLETPARSLTVLSSTAVRYSYADPTVGRPAAVTPDLAQYPLPFFSSTHPQPAPVLFVVPDRPTDTELTALARVAAQLGQYAGSRGIKAKLERVSNVRRADLDLAHAVLIGKESSLPLLSELTNAPLRRDTDGGYLDESGQPVASDTGIVMVMPAPWSSARGVLVVSGKTDDAIAKAALALAARGGIEALRGAYALVPAIAPAPAAPAAARSITLSDLGLGDQQLNNALGDRSLSFTVYLPVMAKDASLPLDLRVSHSGLLDQSRSSMRVLVNGLALESIALRDIAPTHGSHRLLVPGGALRPGANVVTVEFSLRLSGHPGGGCAAIPVEQAWVVLHSDSALTPPAPEAVRSGQPDLSAYPYPYQRLGRLDDTLIVVPDDLGANPQALAELLCELGRGTPSTLLQPRIVTARSFDPARDANDRDVILFGLPADNDILGKLGARLPVEVSQGQRLLLAPDLTIRIADPARLGVVEEVSSPWTPGRSLLVVTGTSAEGLDLAVAALRQRDLSGNVVIASRRQPRPPAPGATATPEPLVYGGPAPIALDVSSYLRRPALLAPQDIPTVPWALITAAVVGLLALIVAFAEGYEALRETEDRS